MELWELVLIALILGLGMGLVPIFSLVIPRTKKKLFLQYDNHYKATFEEWKKEYHNKEQEKQPRAAGVEKNEAIAKRSGYEQQQSDSLLLGLPSEFAAEDARFVGTPTDYVVFKNLNKIVDGHSKEPLEIIFLAKPQGSELTQIQKAVKNAVQEHRVKFEFIKIQDAGKPSVKNAVMTKRYSSDGRTVAA